jgi:AcrR family transcriptional regulator
MGILERKERERTERRALIMRCAKTVILERGADTVSMQDIADAAELSKAALYLYFPSKEALYQEICNESAHIFLEYVRARLAPGLSALESLKMYWQCCLELFSESDELLVVFNLRNYLMPKTPFGALEEGNPACTSHLFFLSIRDLIKQGIDEGFFENSIHPDFMTRTVLNLFSTIVIEAARIPDDALNRANYIYEIKNIFDVLLRGMAKQQIDRAQLALPGIGEKA